MKTAEFRGTVKGKPITVKGSDRGSDHRPAATAVTDRSAKSSFQATAAKRGYRYGGSTTGRFAKKKKPGKITALIRVMFTPEEQEMVIDYAKSQGMSISGFCRDAILRKIGKSVAFARKYGAVQD